MVAIRISDVQHTACSHSSALGWIIYSRTGLGDTQYPFVVLSAGFAITGHVKPEQLLTKSGLKPGQALILTKALGTGSIMAAAMRGQAKGRWISSCLDAMATSSAEAARILRQHGCSAATDVTGFGLVGHAVEMAKASQVGLVCWGQGSQGL
jgi:selenophosphate synthase